MELHLIMILLSIYIQCMRQVRYLSQFGTWSKAQGKSGIIESLQSTTIGHVPDC